MSYLSTLRETLNDVPEITRRIRQARQERATRKEERTARRAERRAQRGRQRSERRSAKAAREQAPRVSLVRAPSRPVPAEAPGPALAVASYNVHRWTGMNGRKAPDPGRAGFVLSQLGADVIALQEVLRPGRGEDPLERIADELGLHLAFAGTRAHRQGELGNAILTRWPMTSVATLDLSLTRIEKRAAVAVEVDAAGTRFTVVATHLALVDRTRHRQVQLLLEHPHLRSGPVILLGDMNAWRRCPATRTLDRELREHGNPDWPATFPSTRPMLALDRVYARGAKVTEIEAHDTLEARKASDHLPVLARVEFAAKS